MRNLLFNNFCKRMFTSNLKKGNIIKTRKPLIEFTVMLPGIKNIDQGFIVKGYEGMSISDVAKQYSNIGANSLGLYIECACDGLMACSTCHIIIDDKWSKIVEPPDEAEQDMIDLAYDSCSTSRLGCQVILSNKHNGLIIHIPSGVNNMMDNIPFKDR